MSVSASTAGLPSASGQPSTTNADVVTGALKSTVQPSLRAATSNPAPETAVIVHTYVRPSTRLRFVNSTWVNRPTFCSPSEHSLFGVPKQAMK